MKLSKDGKTTNITIRVTEDLKKRADDLWQKTSSMMPFNTFLAKMIDVGLEEEKFWLEIKNERAKYTKNDVISRALRNVLVVPQ